VGFDIFLCERASIVGEQTIHRGCLLVSTVGRLPPVNVWGKRRMNSAPPLAWLPILPAQSSQFIGLNLECETLTSPPIPLPSPSSDINACSSRTCSDDGGRPHAGARAGGRRPTRRQGGVIVLDDDDNSGEGYNSRASDDDNNCDFTAFYRQLGM
jgi:hypothetical protein